jgi:hypothetical protein
MAFLLSGQSDVCNRRVSWADLASDEEEDEAQQQLGLALLSAPTCLDDSYREAPLQLLEDSRGGLNKQLAAAADLEAGSLDFAFLLRRIPRPAVAAAPGDEASEDPLPAWQPNVHAPEFIPTLGMTCPVVNVCCTGPAEAAPGRWMAPAGGAPDGSPTKLDTQAMETPEKGTEAARSFRKKKRPPTLQEPEKKRTRSEERQQQQPLPSPGHHPMPEASEDVWMHRKEIREKAIALGKDSPEYRWFFDRKLQEEDREEGEPVTPDPRDRSLSKRQWKYTVQQWRVKLKQRYLDESGQDGSGSAAASEPEDEWESECLPNMQEPEGP